ncbi:MAG TPA: phosphotransferase [Anaerolineales bacterium]|nr:phosphotransferase [Anaerolineales bacterium]
MSTLDPQHSLLDSVEQMLSPETLNALLAKPVRRVEISPMNGHAGLAGGQLSYVDTDAGRLVLKRMSLASDWIMFASQDYRCRSIPLWQYVLDQLLPYLEHKIITCARDGENWAILMADLTGRVFSWNNPMSPELALIFLDALAKLHATFWNDPRLMEAELALCTPAQLLDQTSLPMAQKYKHLSLGVIPEWVRGGWELMDTLLEADVYTFLRELTENPQPLLVALKRYPFTLLHGDYRFENLAYLNGPIALDWQEATCSLMTIDVAWFVKNGAVRETLGQAQAVQAYRKYLQGHLKRPFGDQEWQAMMDLGYLVDALRSTCFSAYWYRQHAMNHRQKEMEYLENEVKLRNQQIRAAMRWL